jgi:hypothetical protein
VFLIEDLRVSIEHALKVRRKAGAAASGINLLKESVDTLIRLRSYLHLGWCHDARIEHEAI